MNQLALNLLLGLFGIFDPELVADVQKMNSDKHAVRLAATNRLQKADERAIPLLRIVAANHPSLEVRVRASQLVGRYHATLKPTSYGRTPWIDRLPLDFPDRDNVHHDYFAKYGTSYCVDDWYDGWRWPTDRLIIDLSMRGWNRVQIIRLLDQMVEGELKWYKENRPNRNMEE